MKIEADLHTHTIASGHAYSTVREMAQAAAGRGLKLIAITDHGPLLPGGPHEYYFGNIKVLPDYIAGVRVLKGVEANIMSDGSLDLSTDYLDKLEFIAAGIHEDAGYYNQNRTAHTEATIRAIMNPRVKMITHPANLYYPIEIEAVVRAAREHDVILEVNASSFDSYRVNKRGSKELTLKMCKLARKYGVPVSLNSDAHYYEDVGNIKAILPIVEEAGLKESDIINTSLELLNKVIDF
ncbi:PHP domain-containing protein [Iocasia frigidifontis]|uniref:PHP domain-containing protein n=1 Tax=Iocasia fonsfrigidae TaxID=2682810 RepID=A0A8A7K628_9FIRM|nr:MULTISPECIES: phosphatase [Halanaerobiaceae]AZO93850.1 phosphatase [Halocella sp. SP3-1]QTL96791.1 PHP domain-containing protein [Iocasia fonsfrigidae]